MIGEAIDSRSTSISSNVLDCDSDADSDSDSDYTIIQSCNHTIIQLYNHTIMQSYNHTIIQSHHHTIIGVSLFKGLNFLVIPQVARRASSKGGSSFYVLVFCACMAQTQERAFAAYLSDSAVELLLLGNL